ncbi:MFS transporter [Planomonospora venezuelensis]|uniref:MFS family permease n=1 Tax=Planomonospora venezuelensis TaxID=1999 RepID=A0A841CU92_PLAVE|nr:MFS transporter [Planomonospora venezuelensis]MBB5961401.1 MFS family permease [Planomonospora venezuelensis]GIN01855.1 MFS transporter [Planomonospora venezuelensis]
MGLRGVWQERPFRLLWCGLTASVAADHIFPIAVVVSLLRDGHGGSAVGVVLAGRLVALVAFAVFGGVWADRLPRRAVMTASQCTLLLIVTVAALWPSSEPVVLGLAVFLAGGTEAFFRPAFQACLASVLPMRLHRAGIGLTSASWRIGAVTGSIAGALAVMLQSPRTALWLAAAGFAAGALLLRHVQEPAASHEDRLPVSAEIRQGVAEVSRRPWMATMISVTALHQTLIVAPAQVLLPVTTVSPYRSPLEGMYGLTLAALSLGGLVGALVATRLSPRRPGLVAMIALLPYGLVPLALMEPIVPGWVFTCYLLAGIGLEISAIEWIVGMLGTVRPDRQARVASLEWMAALSMSPFALALTVPLADLLGRTFLLAASAACALLPLLALLVPGLASFRSGCDGSSDRNGSASGPADPGSGSRTAPNRKDARPAN